MSETVEPQTENVVVGKVTQESLETPVEEAQENVQEKAQNIKRRVNLLEIDLTDENAALRVLIGFIGLAQQRGAFAINESAKIYDCIKLFQKPAGAPPADN